MPVSPGGSRKGQRGIYFEETERLGGPFAMGDRGAVSSLKDVLDGIFNDGTFPFTRDDLRIWDIWEEVVGAAVAANARPARIKNGVLRVSVSDSIWLQELKYQEETVRKGLNDVLGRAAVSKVEFKLKLR